MLQNFDGFFREDILELLDEKVYQN